MAAIMRGRDTLFASLAECFVTINGKRWNLMQAINLEATMEKNKVEVPILGKTGKGHKANGWTGSGSCTLHYNQSVLREYMKEYKNTGLDMYCDIQITNYDPTSAAGRQTIILKDVNFDSMVLAKFDADGEYLDEDVEFTFDDWEMPQSFNILDGME